MSDEECESCGREDGHYIGCPKAHGGWSDQGGDVHLPPKDSGLCAFGDCTRPTRPKGKGRAPIYCIKHSDPKNRK